MNLRVTIQVTFILKGGLMLAEKDMFASNVAASRNNHQFRKFASHYFTEMENDKVDQISALERASDITTGVNAKYQVPVGATYGDTSTYVDVREKNNWVDKFHTGFTGSLEKGTSTHQQARATLTDGNYGVGRSGYESAFSTLLHYPTFMDVGKLNSYTYRGGKASSDGTADTSLPYVTADVAHANQVYGMKISDGEINAYDAANKGQQYLGADINPAVGQTASEIGAAGDLDFNGQGGADGSMFAERSQFYQNEASRFASKIPIDDQWRNPDQHNYVKDAGTTGTADDTDIFRQTLAHSKSSDPWFDRWTLHTDLDNVIEADTRWQESTRYQPIEYKNGLVEASKCHQCCNTDHNCNWNWQPTTKVDWNFAYVWRYQAIDERSNTPNMPAGSNHGGAIDTMGVGSEDRDADRKVISTLSQVLNDHHFNFPPYMANHEINRGGSTGTVTTANLGDPMGTEVYLSDGNSAYSAVSPGGTFSHYDVSGADGSV